VRKSMKWAKKELISPDDAGSWKGILVVINKK
jgi:hypothetical protein